MTRQFTNRNLVGGFLELENLLVHKLALLVMDDVRVERAFLIWLVAWHFGATALPRKGEAREAAVNDDIFTMVAGLAANVYCGRLR
jgi:hypothetical protein